MSETPSIECPLCASTSYNPNDVSNAYCARCGRFVGDMVAEVEQYPERTLRELGQLREREAELSKTIGTMNAELGRVYDLLRKLRDGYRASRETSRIYEQVADDLDRFFLGRDAIVSAGELARRDRAVPAKVVGTDGTVAHTRPRDGGWEPPDGT